MTSFELRPARSEDAAELTRIAHAAKRHWSYPEDWIRLWEADLTISATTFTEQRMICAVESDGRILGFYGVSSEEDECELEHLWVDPAAMGRGVGACLLAHAVSTARELGGRRLRIASDPNAIGFYEKYGARPVGSLPATPPGRELPLLEISLVEGPAPR